MSDKSYNKDYKLFNITAGLIEENPATAHINVRDHEGYFAAFRAVPDFPHQANVKVILPAGVCNMMLFRFYVETNSIQLVSLEGALPTISETVFNYTALPQFIPTRTYFGLLLARIHSIFSGKVIRE